MAPKLLVSVRNRVEAIAALAGGCDVLDVKEPLQGALGRASWDVIAEVAEERGNTELSAALGELREWTEPEVRPSQLVFDRVAGSLRFAKLGLAGWQTNDRLLVKFMSVVELFRNTSTKLQWVAVAYADWQLANAPNPNEVLAAVDELQAHYEVPFAAVLVDTFTKGEQRLFDFLPETKLRALRDEAHTRGLQFAVAGRLQKQDLPRLLPIDPDIVAVRSAVCATGCRLNEVTEQAVAEFRAALTNFR